MPFFSVLITAYNREMYLEEAVKSVLDSTFRDFELIIVDDGSVDDTFLVARNLAETDKRIFLYRNEKNLGQFQNRNKAASYATGNFIVFVDSDDTIFPDALQKFFDIIAKYSKVNFGMYLYNQYCEVFQLTSSDAIKKHFFNQSFLTIGPGGTFIKRTFFYEISGYPTKYGAPGDLYFNLNAASKTNIVFLPFEFMFYRRHVNQEINNPFSYLINNYRYLNDALIELPLPLSKKEIKRLSLKNKRRFIINVFFYLVKSKDLKKSMEACHLANFGVKDFLQGIFN